KKFTSKAIAKEVSKLGESRREWLLERFRKAADQSAKGKNYKVWQSGNHAIELYNQRFTWIKVNYIHQNPVRAGLVEKAEDWKYSSASNYLERKQNVLEEVICIPLPINLL
ncbi:MAG: transposase, partial [Vicingaceae bacterium]